MPSTGNVVAASRKPHGADATPPKLEVVLDNQVVDDGTLTVDENELVRFQISTLILGISLDSMEPDFGFTYGGFSQWPIEHSLQVQLAHGPRGEAICSICWGRPT